MCVSTLQSSVSMLHSAVIYPTLNPTKLLIKRLYNNRCNPSPSLVFEDVAHIHDLDVVLSVNLLVCGIHLGTSKDILL